MMNAANQRSIFTLLTGLSIAGFLLFMAFLYSLPRHVLDTADPYLTLSWALMVMSNIATIVGCCEDSMTDPSTTCPTDMRSDRPCGRLFHAMIVILAWLSRFYSVYAFSHLHEFHGVSWPGVLWIMSQLFMIPPEAYYLWDIFATAATRIGYEPINV